MRKLAPVLISPILCVALAALPALAKIPFTDVPPNHWAYDAIDDLYAEGIIKGYPDEPAKAERSTERRAPISPKALPHKRRPMSAGLQRRAR